MEIILLTIGKTTQPHIIDGINEYLRRLKRLTSYRIECLPDVKKNKTITAELQKEKEGELILNYLNHSDMSVLLDEHGAEYSSIEFSSQLQKMMSSGRKRIVFIIGGPYGFSKQVYQRADTKISLSKMTFTHEMVRLFFTEQIYRAFTILRGEPYHHE